VLSLVVFQLGGRLEERHAVLARVGRLAGVGLEVSAQVGHLHEKPIAVRTPKRLFAGVQPDVGLEMVVAGETLVTHRTHERLFAGVRALVVLQYVLVAELFAANRALERPRLARARRGRRVGRRRGRRHGRRRVVRGGRRRLHWRLIVVALIQPVGVSLEHLMHDLHEQSVRVTGPGRVFLLLLADGVLQTVVRANQQRA